MDYSSHTSFENFYYGYNFLSVATFFYRSNKPIPSSMTENITESTLLLYFYNELPKGHYEAVQMALKNNLTLRMQYEKLIGPLAALGMPVDEPSPTSIAIIMEQAAQLHNDVAAE